MAENLPGICWHRTVFAKHSANYLYQLKRTICHKWRSVMTVHSFHAKVIGICRIYWRATLQHENFPFQLPASHLFFEKMSISFNSLKSIKDKCILIELKVNAPVGQYPSEKICELKSCCCNCRPSRKSHERTVLSRPPVHKRLPSGLISIHDAPSVWPWNCRTRAWLCRSQTAIWPSLQQEKHTFESGLMANA